MSAPAVCVHGSLRRSCEPCDLAERLEASEARIGDLHAALVFLLDDFGLTEEDMVDFVRQQALERDPDYADNSWHHPHVKAFQAALACLQRAVGR